MGKLQDELREHIRCLLKHDSTANTSEIYKILAQTERSLGESLVKDILTSCKQNKLLKYLVYLHLLATQNKQIVQDFLNYEKRHVTFEAVNAENIFEYCFYKRDHWFLQFLERYNESAKDFFPDATWQKILVIKLFDITSQNDFSVERLCEILQNVSLSADGGFIKNFILELQRSVKFVEVVRNLSHSLKANDAEIVNFVVNSTLLEVGAKYLDLNENSIWEKFLEDLTGNEELLKIQESSQTMTTQGDLFAAFTVILDVLRCLNICGAQKPVNIASVIENAKATLLCVKSSELQLEILSIVFALLFTQEKHLKTNNCGEKSKFICTKTDVQTILQFLQSVCETIKVNNTFQNDATFEKIDQYTTDALWRFRLIENLKNLNCKENYQLIPYMAASPNSLINLCMKHGAFERAQHIIQMYGLQDTYLASEIKYTLYLQEFRQKLRDLYRESSSENEITNLLEQFQSSYTPTTDETLEKLISHAHFRSENHKFMDLFDLTLTEATKLEICHIFMNTAFQNHTLDPNVTTNYSKFCNKIHQLFTAKKTNRLSIAEIIISPHYPLDLNKYESQEHFYKVLDKHYNAFVTTLSKTESGALNHNHPAHLALEKLCETCDSANPSHKYLQKLFVYLRAFSKVLYIGDDNSNIVSHGQNVSYFELLECNRALLMGQLLFDNKIDPSEFEVYFAQLKLDLLYHITGNCFPTINLHRQENISDEELYVENQLCEPTPEIISYIQKRNWLLAFILIDMYKKETSNVDFSEARLRILSRYLHLARVQNLKVLFGDNELITALQNEISSHKVINFLNERMLSAEQSLNNSHSSDDSTIEVAEEIFEDNLKVTDWKYLYDVIESIPENQLRRNREYCNLRDLILTNIVTSMSVIDCAYAKYVRLISDAHLRIEHVLSCFKHWPVDFCVDLLRSELSAFEKPPEDFGLEGWLEKLEFYRSVMEINGAKTWHEVHTLCTTNPEELLHDILLTAQIQVLLKYLDIFKPDENFLRQIDVNYLSTVFDTDVDLSDVRRLLEKLPEEQAVHITYNLLKLLRKISYLQFCIDYLLQTTKEETEILKNVQMSLKILSCFPQNEQEQLWCLVHDPLSILEVLIMNTKLDKLGQVLSLIKRDLIANEHEENCLSCDKLDELLRNYAEKSLDFRVILHSEQRPVRPSENKLLQSMDSFTFGAESKSFVMPANVPTKDEWVANDEVLECMCCQLSKFSMFNRRHHCRRCGRVVCYNCSQKRMIVATYGDILVRVCSKCYEQSYDGNSSVRSESTSIKSNLDDFWFLTDDASNNAIVREEFSYEHAPCVSLCLAILKHHSKTPEYPKFLLDQCETMIKFLQPGHETAQEIDYLLVIKMLKSLAIAAKMLCAECMLHWGSTLADKILSQADLLSLLVDRGCLHLLPMSAQHGSFIDASNLRRLRDKLLEREQWNLALEVSTKAGLDNAGVFVAWGKSCLKAGSMQLAREKFQRCFDKTAHYDSSEFFVSMDSDDVTTSRSRLSSRSSLLPENKPAKNPPLLNDILHILQTTTGAIHPSLLKKPEPSTGSLNSSPANDSAVCILNKLRNLSAVAAGNYDSEVESGALETGCMNPLFYDECVYYLQKYGTHFSLLQFYIRNGEFVRALNYILEYKLSTDVFTEVYMMCLEDGLVNVFQEHLAKMDSTLEFWKDYLIQICRYLEKQNMLNSLYQLQRFMGDYVRAAMTCIRFYKENVTTFSELVGRFHFLQQAEEHLKQDLEQQQWVEVASVRKGSVDSAASFEEKSLANPALVMRVDSRAIGKHINTIWREIEVVRFLAQCESAGRVDFDVLPELIPKICDDSKLQTKAQKPTIPTLFDSQREKIQLAVLAIICGENVEEGFGVAYRVIEDNKIKPVKVFALAGKQLAKAEKYAAISQLVRCIQTSGLSGSVVADICDEMLLVAVRTLVNADVSGAEVEELVKLIGDKGLKISAYIEAKQLKTAYFLAVKYKRMSDIRRIMREAELLNHPNIKALCQKFLQAHSSSVTQKFSSQDLKL